MKIAVAMSGGVDSSVTAALLQKDGHEVIGLTYLLVDATEQAAAAADSVARMLGIPHHVIDFKELYTNDIIANFCEQYVSGKTPNPCVRCNRLVKFGALMEKAQGFGAEMLATGHYARIEKRTPDNRFLLKKGVDSKRDQSYFLYRLTQSQLEKALFPLGTLTKDKVRELAQEFNLPVADRPESREICFIPDNNYPRFVREHLKSELKTGQIVDKQGKVLGQHHGIIDYTIGQRKGLGISSTEPLYVVDIDANNNTVVVGSKEDVYASEFVVTELNWITLDHLTEPLTLKVKIRYLHPEAEATITPIEESVTVKFTVPQMAITPGQSVVFYDGDTVVGGGTIERVLH